MQEDCDAICNLISESFSVDQDNSMIKGEELDPDKFGYLSTHYVLSIGSDRSNLPEFTLFKELKAEIQVRTLLQHAWAAIDWKFRYKEQKEAPKQLRRRLFRISALLEAADNEFSLVNKAIQELRQSYSEAISSAQLNISLNTESVALFLKESAIVNTVIRVAGSKGINTVKNYSDEVLSRLVSTAQILSIETLEDLDKRLRSNERHLSSFFEIAKNKLDKSRFNLLRLPALIRYVLMISATISQRRIINLKHRPINGWAEALSEFSSRNRQALLPAPRKITRQ